MKKLSFAQDVSVKIGSILLAIWLPGYAQETEVAMGETEVKSAIEYAAVKVICSDQTLLDNVEIDFRDCPDRASAFASLCWKVVDKVVPSYEFILNEKVKERFMAIADVYTYCVQAELLILAIKIKKPHVK